MSHTSSRTAGGFSLVELLTVIGVILLLGAIAVPVSVNVMTSSNLTRGGQMLLNEMNAARQLALTRNRPVEMRFYQVGNGASQRYRAFGTYVVEPTGKKVAAGSVAYLPQSIVIAGDESISSLLKAAGPGSDYTGTENIPNQNSASYVCFRFREDGGADLIENREWFVTLARDTGRQLSASAMPDNYVTIQLDPVTGRVRTYRP